MITLAHEMGSEDARGEWVKQYDENFSCVKVAAENIDSEFNSLDLTFQAVRAAMRATSLSREIKRWLH